MRLLLLIFMAIVLMPHGVWADQDAGLYDPQAPEGSAFVRFLNLEEQDIVPKVENKKYKRLGEGQVSVYFIVPEGAVEIVMGEQDVQGNIVSGAFYTAVHHETGFLLQDTANANRSKAVIAFYNLSDNPDLTLKARGGTVNVLEHVKKNATKARDMNAVKIDFSIYSGEENILSLAEEVIERGNHYSIFYDGEKVQFITATTNTRR